ncbi:MAG: hypothetical protein E7774_09105 [Bradyrhizobium sp.]|nr:MAG: hypothetical protein E7774_09105 [Bradyrhizobium sp.]
MSDALNLGWSSARARSRLSAYRAALGFNILLEFVIGVACLTAPDFVSHALGAPPPSPSGWMRGWGALLILVAALYLPGLQNPLRSRYANIVGIVGRVWTALVWFCVGGGLIWLGVFDLAFALVLAWLFYRYCVSELMSRP